MKEQLMNSAIYIIIIIINWSIDDTTTLVADAPHTVILFGGTDEHFHWIQLVKSIMEQATRWL